MLSVEGLNFSFSGRTVLDRVGFELKPHSVTCLIGGNGSGKTTLFNLLTGFLRPESGSIRFGERDITSRPPYLISQMGVARTFQDLRLIGGITVRENVLLAIPDNPSEKLAGALMPPKRHRRHNAADHNQAELILSGYFLSEIADQLASDISYGQQKLLTLACCAAMDARLFLLDEPVAGINPNYRERIAERLANLKANGSNILLIEHQTDFLERTGDSFLFLHAGRLHLFDTFAELRASAVAQTFIGP
tara:strand:- start:482 stop:1228 length:747 start_codon:yes stop_codon:yes gene_type:complete